MAHEIEINDGKVSMAWVGQVPWHGLGVELDPNVTPYEMLQAANLDWEVKKIPAFATVAGKKVSVGHSALVRSSDNKVLDVVGDDWEPNQNSTAFEFFTDFVSKGKMQMHTAGSLKGGRIVWALAKVDESFTLFNGDRVDSYLLFTNPHKYGQSINVRFTPIRVVCNNTLTLSLSGKTENQVTVSHRTKFNAEEVKEILGMASHKLGEYKDMAAYLGSKYYTTQTVSDYFSEVFPVITSKKESRKKHSLSATRSLTILEQQPGFNYARGTWWSAVNAVTFLTDHLISRNADNRLNSSWYGQNRGVKINALKTALDYAKAA